MSHQAQPRTTQAFAKPRPPSQSGARQCALKYPVPFQNQPSGFSHKRQSVTPRKQSIPTEPVSANETSNPTGTSTRREKKSKGRIIKKIIIYKAPSGKSRRSGSRERTTSHSNERQDYQMMPQQHRFQSLDAAAQPSNQIDMYCNQCHRHKGQRNQFQSQQQQQNVSYSPQFQSLDQPFASLSDENNNYFGVDDEANCPDCTNNVSVNQGGGGSSNHKSSNHASKHSHQQQRSRVSRSNQPQAFSLTPSFQLNSNNEPQPLNLPIQVHQTSNQCSNQKPPKRPYSVRNGSSCNSTPNLKKSPMVTLSPKIHQSPSSNLKSMAQNNNEDTVYKQQNQTEKQNDYQSKFDQALVQIENEKCAKEALEIELRNTKSKLQTQIRELKSTCIQQAEQSQNQLQQFASFEQKLESVKKQMKSEVNTWKSKCKKLERQLQSVKSPTSGLMSPKSPINSTNKSIKSFNNQLENLGQMGFKGMLEAGTVKHHGYSVAVQTIGDRLDINSVKDQATLCNFKTKNHSKGTQSMPMNTQEIGLQINDELDQQYRAQQAYLVDVLTRQLDDLRTENKRLKESVTNLERKVSQGSSIINLGQTNNFQGFGSGDQRGLATTESNIGSDNHHISKNLFSREDINSVQHIGSTTRSTMIRDNQSENNFNRNTSTQGFGQQNHINTQESCKVERLVSSKESKKTQNQGSARYVDASSSSWNLPRQGSQYFRNELSQNNEVSELKEEDQTQSSHIMNTNQQNRDISISNDSSPDHSQSNHPDDNNQHLQNNFNDFKSTDFQQKLQSMMSPGSQTHHPLQNSSIAYCLPSNQNNNFGFLNNLKQTSSSNNTPAASNEVYKSSEDQQNQKNLNQYQTDPTQTTVSPQSYKLNNDANPFQTMNLQTAVSPNDYQKPKYKKSHRQKQLDNEKQYNQQNNRQQSRQEVNQDLCHVVREESNNDNDCFGSDFVDTARSKQKTPREGQQKNLYENNQGVNSDISSPMIEYEKVTPHHLLAKTGVIQLDTGANKPIFDIQKQADLATTIKPKPSAQKQQQQQRQSEQQSSSELKYGKAADDRSVFGKTRNSQVANSALKSLNNQSDQTEDEDSNDSNDSSAEKNNNFNQETDPDSLSDPEKTPTRIQKTQGNNNYDANNLKIHQTTSSLQLQSRVLKDKQLKAEIRSLDSEIENLQKHLRLAIGKKD